ncbi:universal stress protein [Corallococcus sp. H22C18031201]|uniref:universal stress protein n=1 Tax=Citreicoccus inhibens TaxID=2849499 RepID=UPI000E758D2F|nr:universal stress protein [Citreicoccus inhibens]MBU8894621.1 universal stress protein [Citreicoccus inhibens]RJS25205.1 universal stress protein [Corallococcus sp. H22C18031201]
MTAPSHILVPVDLTEGSAAVVDYALQIARPFGASVDIVHAWEPPQYVAPDLLVASPGWSSQTLETVAVDTAKQDLDTLVKDLEHPEVSVQHRVLVGEPGATILDEIERGKFDLVVMGTHGRRGLSRLLLGSVAQKVVSRAASPVLTLHLQPTK